MAATYTALGTATPIANLATALAAAGLITTNHYQDAQYLIITTPISSKVMKFRWTSSRMYIYYGDAYSSGSTITNETSILYSNTGTGTAVHIVCDTTFFLIAYETGVGAAYAVGYVGALTNGDELVFGFTSASNSSYYGGCHSWNMTDGTELLPVTWAKGFNDGGTLLEQPLYWFNPSGRQIEKDGSNFAETVGVKNVSFQGSTVQMIVGVNHLITPGTMYNDTAAGQAIWSSLIVEF